jgi:hypothetical protein
MVDQALVILLSFVCCESLHSVSCSSQFAGFFENVIGSNSSNFDFLGRKNVPFEGPFFPLSFFVFLMCENI